MTSSTVILVEDDDDMREDLAFLIAQRGFDVCAVANGKEALEKMDALPGACIILLDLMMPVMDGWELRARLLQKPKWANVPVVVVSGISDIQANARSLKAVGYLQKPIDFPKLYQLVEDHCTCNKAPSS